MPEVTLMHTLPAQMNLPIVAMAPVMAHNGGVLTASDDAVDVDSSGVSAAEESTSTSFVVGSPEDLFMRIASVDGSDPVNGPGAESEIVHALNELPRDFVMDTLKMKDKNGRNAFAVAAAHKAYAIVAAVHALNPALAEEREDTELKWYSVYYLLLYSGGIDCFMQLRSPLPPRETKKPENSFITPSTFTGYASVLDKETTLRRMLCGLVVSFCSFVNEHWEHNVGGCEGCTRAVERAILTLKTANARGVLSDKEWRISIVGKMLPQAIDLSSTNGYVARIAALVRSIQDELKPQFA